jgi:hypothetical protein
MTAVLTVGALGAACTYTAFMDPNESSAFPQCPLRLVTGVEMPVFEKRRFQQGAIAEDRFTRLFPEQEQAYRDAYTQVWA